MYRNLPRTIVFLLAFLSLSHLAAVPIKHQDFRAPHQPSEIVQMQKYHLQQAEQKLARNQPAYAWGDFAYLLCYIPNHHLALKQMLSIAQELNKQHEMQKFFDNARAAYPEDGVVCALLARFYAKNGDTLNATKYKALALNLDPNLPAEYLD